MGIFRQLRVTVEVDSCPGVSVSLFGRYSPRAKRVIFYSLHYAREAGAACIEPEHILEGLLLEDPQLFNLVLPERPSLVKDLKDEITKWRAEAIPQTQEKELPLSRTAKAVVAGAGTHQHRLGHASIATQHLLLALLTACRRNPSWFRKRTELPVQQLLSKHGITPELTENKTSSGIVTPTTWVLDDQLVSLNAQIAALAELLTEKRLFTRAEFVSLLDRSEGPLVPETFVSPLIEALGKDGILTANEQQKVVTAAAKPVDKAPSDERKNPPS
jgi:Clp amino terminal domain, pathogenicity island component